MVTIEVINVQGEIERVYKGEPMVLFNRNTEIEQKFVAPQGLVALVSWSSTGDPHIEYYIGILL